MLSWRPSLLRAALDVAVADLASFLTPLLPALAPLLTPLHPSRMRL